MNRQRLNRIIRVVLALVLVGVFALTVVSARPGYQFLGAYNAMPATQYAVFAMFEQAALYITVFHPAVVYMPDGWGVGDKVCMAVRMVRGPARTEISFSEYLPQVEWDKKPGDTVIFGPDNILARDTDGGRFAVANRDIAPHVTTDLKYRVNWFASEFIPILDGTPQGGLMCYHFVARKGATEVQVVPFYHTLSFLARNINVTRRPSYRFAYNVPPDDPALKQEGTFVLQRMDINTYLAQMAVDAPFAVKPLTQAQADQRATETAP